MHLPPTHKRYDISLGKQVTIRKNWTDPSGRCERARGTHRDKHDLLDTRCFVYAFLFEIHVETENCRWENSVFEAFARFVFFLVTAY